MSDEVDAVVERVRERVTPGDDERAALQAIADRLTERAEDAIASLPVDAHVVRVGSTARGTWTAGDRDLDLFVCFPPELDREELEEYGLSVGHAVLPAGHEEYAEHPYVKGTVDGYDVDLVPCYDVADAATIQSAVDRTPFHTRYLAERLDETLAADVRVCKQFMKAIGVYGSDLRTEGFSGYLTELLVLEHDGFRPLVEAAAAWTPPLEFDPADHGRESFDDPLVVIDPTDPERNVAAVLSATQLATFQHYARELVAEPRADLFESSEPEPVDAETVRAWFERRGTTPVAVRFDAPDLVDDQLWPQLERSLSGVTDALNRRGFDVLRSAAFADETAVLLAELEVAERPTIERHEGPPVHVRDHAAGFYEKYAAADATGPYVDGDRYVVERDREFATASAFLRSDALSNVALGTHVASALEAEYEVLVGEAVASLAGEFGVELADYVDPKP
ncbi:CCA tRNA nucleotidyltransferase [Halomicrobium sp. HM KBTZ05]|uniref:CCA tRNA nucleotidyltransferase n=1 Tax=Halomicrobium sp. HM KBTZ05 TaxID=3242663 RepID=UPI0035561ED1